MRGVVLLALLALALPTAALATTFNYKHNAEINGRPATYQQSAADGSTLTMTSTFGNREFNLAAVVADGTASAALPGARDSADILVTPEPSTLGLLGTGLLGTGLVAGFVRRKMRE